MPFLLDVQADLLRGLATRVVIPLVKPSETEGRMVSQLHFEVEVAGQRLIALGSELAAIPPRRSDRASRTWQPTARRSSARSM